MRERAQSQDEVEDDAESAPEIDLSEIDHENDPEFPKPPDWVIEAEEMYVKRKLGTHAHVAQHFGVAKTYVAIWAMRRKWTDLRKRADDLSARQLRDRIVNEAAEELTDAFAGIQQDTLRAGQWAARLIAMFEAQELQRMKDAAERGETYVPASLAKSHFEVRAAALHMMPRAKDEADLDDLSALLNPPKEDG